MKRLLVATFFGLVMGGVCASAAFTGGLLKFTSMNVVWILLNRTVMGFAIGASGLKLPWGWNGVVMGMLVGSIFSYFLFMNLGWQTLPVINFFVNGIFGLIIEFFTTVVFKQPMLSTSHGLGRAASV